MTDTTTTPEGGPGAAADRLRSRHVRVDELPWERTEFPGVEYKTLLIDKAQGLLTVLLKMAPGAVLPDHEHVRIEQTYVLEGRLVDKAGAEVGLEVGPGEFVWRPAGSRHAAWTPDGALMIAMFLVPNRFYDKDGREIDMLGDDWDAKWRSALG
jgi:anti-sigma factor ChrR (cupin superfamily)